MDEKFNFPICLKIYKKYKAHTIIKSISIGAHTIDTIIVG